jgi:glycosyltransferase involved in cell wall biosynthesis
MFQNALPFEGREKNRFFFTSPLYYIKWNLLKITQGLTHKLAQGALFPSYYLEDLVWKNVPQSHCSYSRVVPHGINPIFFNIPRIEQETLFEKKEIRLLYVSRIDFYKHQCEVVKAAEMLHKMNIRVRLDLCGYVGNKKALTRMNAEIKRVDPTESYIGYHGHLDYHSLPALYGKTDIFIFASSCESISSILLEGMASGLAIACSNMPVAKEVLKDAGVYFNPENPEEIKNAIYELIVNESLRQSCKEKAYRYATQYNWDNCAKDTFLFLNEVAQSEKIGK